MFFKYKWYTSSNKFEVNMFMKATPTCYTLYSPLGIYLHHIAPNTIHGSFHISLDLVPISPALREFINLLHAPDSMEPLGISDESGQFFGMAWINQVNLHKLTERREIEQELVVSQGLDILEVVIHVATPG